MVKCLASIYKALSAIPSTMKKKKKARDQRLSLPVMSPKSVMTEESAFPLQRLVLIFETGRLVVYTIM